MGRAQVNLDSLRLVWDDANQSDTNRLKAIGTISWYGYLFSQPDSSFYYSQLQYDFAQETGHKTHMAAALNRQGISFALQSEYEKAKEYFKKGLRIYRELDEKIGITNCLSGLARVNRDQGDYDKALEFFQKSLKVNMDSDDKWGIASDLAGIGTIYSDQGEYDEAMNYYRRSLKIRVEIGDKSGIAYCLNTIGNIYGFKEENNKALEYFQKSIKIKHELDDQYGISATLNNIATIHKNQGETDMALDYYSKSLRIQEEIGDQRGAAMSLKNIGTVYEDLEMYHKAKDYGSRGLELAQEIGLAITIRESSEVLWRVYKKLGKSKESLEMYELFIETRDSMESEENQKAIIRQEYKYEYEMQAAADSIKTAEADKVKDAQLAAEQAENKQHELEAKQQEEQKMYLFGGLGLALLFGGFIFNRFRVTRKQKGIIEEQKRKVDEAYEELEEKNTEILDSINYAKRIQSAILPPTKLVKEYLNQSFILYKPKDIVAGDFYWMEPSEKGVLFAAADCTGHGVPGAMVSVVCNNGLNRSVREYGLTDPGQILDKTREIVISEFEKSEEEVKDGMDIALCSLEGRTLKYAGAHNPLWIIRKDTQEVEEIKADKQPIGKYAEPKPYTTHTIELQEGDSFYIFSDGYADQFGGERGKKYKSANFKKLFISLQNESMEQQHIKLNETFEAWRGALEQLDDVCVIGVRL